MKHIVIRYGGLMFLGFTAFFLSMHLLHLSHNYYLRVLNGAIQGTGIWLALRAWLDMHPERHDDYPSGVALGLLTTLFAVVPFAVFIAIFLAYDPVFMHQIRVASPMGQYLNPVMAGALILMEGIAAGLIGTYVLMRIQEAIRHPV